MVRKKINSPVIPDADLSITNVPVDSRINFSIVIWVFFQFLHPEWPPVKAYPFS